MYPSQNMSNTNNNPRSHKRHKTSNARPASNNTPPALDGGHGGPCCYLCGKQGKGRNIVAVKTCGFHTLSDNAKHLNRRIYHKCGCRPGRHNLCFKFIPHHCPEDMVQDADPGHDATDGEDKKLFWRKGAKNTLIFKCTRARCLNPDMFENRNLVNMPMHNECRQGLNQYVQGLEEAATAVTDETVIEIPKKDGHPKPPSPAPAPAPAPAAAPAPAPAIREDIVAPEWEDVVTDDPFMKLLEDMMGSTPRAEAPAVLPLHHTPTPTRDTDTDTVAPHPVDIAHEDFDLVAKLLSIPIPRADAPAPVSTPAPAHTPPSLPPPAIHTPPSPTSTNTNTNTNTCDKDDTASVSTYFSDPAPDSLPGPVPPPFTPPKTHTSDVFAYEPADLSPYFDLPMELPGTDLELDSEVMPARECNVGLSDS